MLGKRSDQRGLFEADHMYIDLVGRNSFYGFLASQRGQLFRDEEFSDLYVLDNGRPSVPPSLLATALLLQAYDGVSDQEAKERADFDMRWKVALGIGVNERPFAKSTLQVFRGQLIVHGALGDVFRKSLQLARGSGHLKGRRVKVALDTSNILGRGAVKDTYNLLGDGIIKLIRELASLEGVKAEVWAGSNGYAHYHGSSVKGEAGIDWDDAVARQRLLAGIVKDADGLLETARLVRGSYAPGSDEDRRLKEAAELLGRLLLQDIERDAEGPMIRRGTARDRVISVHDPEMRHGRKSKSKRFDGHKAALAVDVESELITAVAVLPGNAKDCAGALELVEQTEENTGAVVDETIGDCAYGEGALRQQFADAGRKLVAKVPPRPNGAYFAKDDFHIDVAARTCVCPAGERCRKVSSRGRIKGHDGRTYPRQVFQFSPALCAVCPMRPQCVKATGFKGRTVSLHPQEALLQEARALQRSDEYGPYRKMRQVAEHRIARLMQLGMRQARYFTRVKTQAQLLLAATIANLTLIAKKMGYTSGGSRGQTCVFSCALNQIALFATAVVTILNYPAYQLNFATKPQSVEVGFRPDF